MSEEGTPLNVEKRLGAHTYIKSKSTTLNSWGNRGGCHFRKFGFEFLWRNPLPTFWPKGKAKLYATVCLMYRLCFSHSSIIKVICIVFFLLKLSQSLSFKRKKELLMHLSHWKVGSCRFMRYFFRGYWGGEGLGNITPTQGVKAAPLKWRRDKNIF